MLYGKHSEDSVQPRHDTPDIEIRFKLCVVAYPVSEIFVEISGRENDRSTDNISLVVGKKESDSQSDD